MRPLLGMRAKLYARGSGKWAKSGGEAAKFGLTTPEMLEAVKILKSRRMLDAMVMLHFHIGSQITDIGKIKNAIREAGRVYAKLRAHGGSDPVPEPRRRPRRRLRRLQDGVRLLDELLRAGVRERRRLHVKQICDEENVPAPTLVTESGRAVTAYHSVLVTNVLDVADRIEQERRVRVTSSDAPGHPGARGILVVHEREEPPRELPRRRQQYKEELFTLFNLGHLSLEDRSKGEILFWHDLRAHPRDLKTLKEIPEEFEDMEKMLADTYVANFSVFQSLPDSWAIDQLFPILPIHRLNERPTEVGTLADITCDSDGKIDKFIDLRDIKETLPLHTFRQDEPYYVAFCLIGAYQDVLGDLHNLFGEAHEVLVSVDDEGTPQGRGRPPRRGLRARSRVHELRPDGDSRLDQQAAAPGDEPPRQEGRGPAHLQGVRGDVPAVHVPGAISRGLPGSILPPWRSTRCREPTWSGRDSRTCRAGSALLRLSSSPSPPRGFAGSASMFPRRFPIPRTSSTRCSPSPIRIPRTPATTP